MERSSIAHFEKRTSEAEFQQYIHLLLEIIGNRNIILGVGDMVLGNNLIERVEYVAKKVEHHRLVWNPPSASSAAPVKSQARILLWEIYNVVD